MIVIDMDMPKNCVECPLFDDRWDYPTCYLNRLSSGYNFPIGEKKMDFCPIKCDIEDIKAEINQKTNSGQWSDATVYGMWKALAIIDKHIGENGE